MKKLKLIWSYLKTDKILILLYLLLFGLTYIPPFLTPIFSGYALESLVTNNLNGFIINLIILSSIYLFSYTIIRVPLEYLYNYLEIKFMSQVSKDLYHKIDNLPCIAFEDIGVGEYINRLYNDIDRIMELLKKLIKMFCRFLVIVAFLIISFKINYLIGIEILIFAFIMGFISSKYFPKIKKKNELIKQETDIYLKNATENINGIREIKSLGIKHNIEKLINQNLNNLFQDSKEVRKYEISYYTFNGLIYLILEFIILITAGIMVYHGKIGIASFVIIESYIWRIDEIVESISDFGVNYNKVIVSLNRLDEILNNRLYQDEKFGNINLQNCLGKITLKNVKFKYKKEDNLILKGLNLKLEPAKKIAIVGKSGNGKTTLFNLLLRYFDPVSGNIFLDDINLKDLTEESLRKNISIIRQMPFIFNKSILDNFRLVKEKVTLKEVREVCKRAYIDDYIMSLPDKYHTIIGEGGVNLSGGEKQRLAIARTLLLNTKVILFDEATSALDNESQEYIKKTINDLVKNHTIIIVAHRLSTIIDADIIHVIANGRCVASGNHEELLKTSEVYKNLYTTEYINYIERN